MIFPKTGAHPHQVRGRLRDHALISTARPTTFRHGGRKAAMCASAMPGRMRRVRASAARFFGRRKGHPLRPRQAALLDDAAAAARARSVRAGARRPGDTVSATRGRRCPARDRLRRRRASRRAGARPSAHRLHRLRAVRQRHGQGAGRDRQRTLGNIRLHFGDATELLAWLPAAALARIDLLYPDPWPKRRHWKRRFVPRRDRRGARARAASGRRIPLRDRHRRLCRLDARRVAALARDFAWTAERADDWRKPWPAFPTRYEAKARREKDARPVTLFSGARIGSRTRRRASCEKIRPRRCGAKV